LKAFDHEPGPADHHYDIFDLFAFKLYLGAIYYKTCLRGDLSGGDPVLEILAHLCFLYQLERFSRTVPFGMRQNRYLLTDTYHHGSHRPAIDNHLYILFFLRWSGHGNRDH